MFSTQNLLISKSVAVDKECLRSPGGAVGRVTKIVKQFLLKVNHYNVTEKLFAKLIIKQHWTIEELLILNV